MKACGLIVEYNPFHNGHVYHLEEAKRITNADCIIAVMSGSFLQRGEPAIIDKYHRTRAAIQTGVDIMLELPYPYAVQSSTLFATGAVKILHEIGVDHICFGSESGMLEPFEQAYETLENQKVIYKEELSEGLNQGLSYPEASTIAYKAIGLTNSAMDLSKPNNILGFSYLQAVKKHQLPIQMHTIKRMNNDYHDETISSPIASATSIRKQLMHNNQTMLEIKETMPPSTVEQLYTYQQKTALWHTWEQYFPYLHYRVMTMSINELALIQGMDEGIEYRIKKTAKTATSFHNWVSMVKSKRYTWTRIQRIFVHLLTNTKKSDMEIIQEDSPIPYLRVLGLSSKGQLFLNNRKKEIGTPIITKLTRNNSEMLQIEERATNAYYSVIPTASREKLFKQELQGPVIIK